nr:hypothetical protein Hi04_10k_c4773_00008 [uncultured bacterium]
MCFEIMTARFRFASIWPKAGLTDVSPLAYIDKLKAPKMNPQRRMAFACLQKSVGVGCARLDLAMAHNDADEMFSLWRFCLFSVVAALLVSATPLAGATITVTNGNDAGPGSLRQALADASPGDIINFASTVTTVALTSGELVVNKDLSIIGPGANSLTVMRATTAVESRIFNLTSSSATVLIFGLTISAGSPVDNGGGIRNSGVLVLSDCAVSQNFASGSELVGGNGAGVLNAGGQLTINRCTISNNSATFSTQSSSDQASCYGGGILNYPDGIVTITESTISDNSCSFSDTFIATGSGGGGGILNEGSMTITNCTISGNSVTADGDAFVYGGGILNSGDLQIASSTIAYNSAANGSEGTFGGGIYSSGSTTTQSSIIALNTSPTGPDVTGQTELQSLGFNIVGDNADSTISSQPTDQIGTPAAPIDPLLEPLADNGGPTLTHALQAGSPAIGRGVPGFFPRDQRGYYRITPDVGAFGFGALPPPGLGNISTRALVQTGDNVVIGGFIVQGTATKSVIVRVLGPDLSQYGISNVLANPLLELHDSTGALIASNNDWATTILGGIIIASQADEIQASGLAPGDGLDSAIIADLSPGSYTAIVSGVNGVTGVGLTEVYDLGGDSGSVLANMSTRALVQTGNDVLIGGFILQGTQPKKVMLRAIGPELAQNGVANPLADPSLELYDATPALIASNNDWMTTVIGGVIISDQTQEIMESGLAPTDSKESGVIATLQPGGYTAIVRGVNNTTGIGLVEIYDLDQ